MQRELLQSVLYVDAFAAKIGVATGDTAEKLLPVRLV
jgi:hypothetical protein